MKTCRGCNESKPIGKFHVDRNNKIDGHKNYCVSCVAERRKTPGYKDMSIDEILCTRCNKIKNRNEFSKSHRAVRGTADWCKKCVAEYHVKYAQNNKEKLRNDAREWYNKSPRGWANGALRSHRNRGHEINITTDELYNYALDKKTCPVCGETLSWGKNNGHIRSHSPSLDRINNEKELNIKNVWIICAKCNMAKGELCMKEFVEYCRNVVARSEMYQAGIADIDPEMEVKA